MAHPKAVQLAGYPHCPRLAGDYYEAEHPRGFVVYAHMMPATKESWQLLAEFLARRGFSGLAVDLRGHGASEGGPDGYRRFSDEEHQASIFDLEAAAEFLRARGASLSRTFFVGASIGANLSLEFLGRHRETPGAVALSAGLVYHGIDAVHAAARIHEGQRVFLAGSHDDLQGSMGSNADQQEAIAGALPKGTGHIARIYETGGHGTRLLSAHPELAQEIATFLTGE